MGDPNGQGPKYGEPLTDEEKLVLDAFRDACSVPEDPQLRKLAYREIRARTGVPVMKAKRLVRAARIKVGDIPAKHQTQHRSTRVEVRDPPKAAKAVMELANPLNEFPKKAAMEASGMNQKSIDRLKDRQHEVIEKLQAVTVEELRPILGAKMRALLESIGEKDYAKASLLQKMTAFGIAFDKDQILQGKPTQIVSVEERRALPELMKMMLHEAERRGLTVEVDPQTQETRVEEPPDAP